MKKIIFISLLAFIFHPTKNGYATFYAHKFNGRKTSSGEIYSDTLMTAASNQYKLGTIVRVTDINSHKTVVVKINDRMALKSQRKGRIVDLSRRAAILIGLTSEKGIISVSVEEI